MGSGDRRGRHRTRGRLCRHRSGRSVCGPLPHSLAATWAALRNSRADGRTDGPSRVRRRGVIRYNLFCDQRHELESWFQNSAAYDKPAKRGLVSCPLCGSSKVEKAIMAPRLARKDNSTPIIAPAEAAPSAPAAAPVEAPKPVAMISPQEREFRKKLKELRDHLTSNADNVGKKFAEVARKTHYGEDEHRSIYGEASPKDAKELHEEGIEFHPLPVLPEERN